MDFIAEPGKISRWGENVGDAVRSLASLENGHEIGSWKRSKAEGVVDGEQRDLTCREFHFLVDQTVAVNGTASANDAASAEDDPGIFGADFLVEVLARAAVNGAQLPELGLERLRARRWDVDGGIEWG